MPDATEAPPPPSIFSSRAPARTPWHGILLLYLLGMAFLFLVPVPARFTRLAGRFDDLAHFAIFLVFAAVHQLDRRPALLRTLAISVCLAGGIELLQAALPFRSAQVMDFVSGTAGAVAGAGLVVLARRWGGTGS